MIFNHFPIFWPFVLSVFLRKRPRQIRPSAIRPWDPARPSSKCPRTRPRPPRTQQQASMPNGVFMVKDGIWWDVWKTFMSFMDVFMDVSWIFEWICLVDSQDQDFHGFVLKCIRVDWHSISEDSKVGRNWDYFFREWHAKRTTQEAWKKMLSFHVF